MNYMLKSKKITRTAGQRVFATGASWRCGVKSGEEKKQPNTPDDNYLEMKNADCLHLITQVSEFIFSTFMDSYL